MMNNENYWGMNLIWWIFWVLLFVFILAYPYLFSRQKRKKDSAISILKKRFANGQIDLEEFHEMKKIIEKKS